MKKNNPIPKPLQPKKKGRKYWKQGKKIKELLLQFFVNDKSLMAIQIIYVLGCFTKSNQSTQSLEHLTRENKTNLMGKENF